MMKQLSSVRSRGVIATSVAALVALAVLVPGSSQGRGSVYDPGDIIVADSGHNAIKAVAPVGGAATPITSGGLFVFPADVTFADDGDILVVDRDAFDNKGGVVRVDSVTGAQSWVTNNDISEEAGGKRLLSNPISLDRKGNSLYITDFHRPPKVIKVNIASGKQSLLSNDRLLAFPGDIVANGVKDPLVADSEVGVIEVKAKNGKASQVSKVGKFPQAISLLNDDNVLVADPDKFDVPGAVTKVNIHSGHKTELARGGPLANPVGVAAADSDTAFVTDTSAPSFPAGGLYEVDLGTGDQTLVNGADFSNPLGLIVAP